MFVCGISSSCAMIKQGLMCVFGGAEGRGLEENGVGEEPEED